MAVVDRVRDLVAPLVADAGAELYDVEFNGGVLRVLVDAADGVEVGVLQRLSRTVGHTLDEADPIPGRYTLEVSSTGLERPLRTEEHYRSALGEQVKVKLGPQVDGERRLQGVVRAVDADGFELETTDGTVHLDLADVTKARTVFEWGPAPKPGGRRDRPSDPQREAASP